MSRYWFRQKRYGFGAVPTSWEGWALTIGYMLALIGLGAWLAPDTRPPTSFLAIGFVLTMAFVALCWRTTEGGWRWRWGDDDRT